MTSCRRCSTGTPARRRGCDGQECPSYNQIATVVSWPIRVRCLIGRIGVLAYFVLINGAGPDRVTAADKQADEAHPSNGDSAFELSEPRTYRLKLTFRVEAKGGALRNVTVTGPVPIDWREQRVKLIEEHKPAGVTTRVTLFPGQAAMLVIRIPAVPAGGFAVVERIYELTRYQVRFRGDRKSLRVPEKPSRTLRKFLGSAPGVEVTDRKIRRLAERRMKRRQ